ncbi:MAG: hypothetical protein K2H98_04340, partial [Duncaniella sp.]|nr:hypothetical protein [Duncaniella sp.]
ALIPQWDYRKLSLIDETDGVVFVDNSLRMPVIQIEKSNTVFDIPPNSGKPRRVKLLKCNGGIVVNSIPYSLIRKVSPAGADTAREMFPRHKDCAQLKRRFAVAQKSWEKHKKSISDEAVRNIFVSAADGEMLGQAMKNIDRLFTETGIRINNVEKLAR